MNRSLLEEVTRVAAMDSQLAECRAELDARNRTIETLSKLELGLSRGVGNFSRGGAATAESKAMAVKQLRNRPG